MLTDPSHGGQQRLQCSYEGHIESMVPSLVTATVCSIGPVNKIVSQNDSLASICCSVWTRDVVSLLTARKQGGLNKCNYRETMIGWSNIGMRSENLRIPKPRRV